MGTETIAAQPLVRPAACPRSVGSVNPEGIQSHRSARARVDVFKRATRGARTQQRHVDNDDR